MPLMTPHLTESPSTAGNMLTALTMTGSTILTPDQTAQRRTSPRRAQAMEFPSDQTRYVPPTSDGQANARGKENISWQAISTAKASPPHLIARDGMEDFMRQSAPDGDISNEIVVTMPPVFTTIAERRKTNARAASRRDSEETSSCATSVLSSAAAQTRKRKASHSVREGQLEGIKSHNQATPARPLSHTPNAVKSRKRRALLSSKRHLSDATSTQTDSAMFQPSAESAQTPRSVVEKMPEDTPLIMLGKTLHSIQDTAASRTEGPTQEAPPEPADIDKIASDTSALLVGGDPDTKTNLSGVMDPTAELELESSPVDWLKISAAGRSQTPSAIFRRMDRANRKGNYGRDQAQLWQMAKEMAKKPSKPRGDRKRRTKKSNTDASSLKEVKESERQTPPCALHAESARFEQESTQDPSFTDEKFTPTTQHEQQVLTTPTEYISPFVEQHSIASAPPMERTPTKARTLVAKLAMTPQSLDDIKKYSRPEENLDWSDITDLEERKRRQSLISSRKYLAKKRATQEAASPMPSTRKNTMLPQASRRERSPFEDVDHAPQSPTPAMAESIHGSLEMNITREMGTDSAESNSELDITREEAMNLSDAEYITHMKKVLYGRANEGKPTDFSALQARRILWLLNAGELVERGSSVDALFTTPENASHFVQAGGYYPNPIFTENAQTMPLQTVDEFFDEYYDDSIKVMVQDPAKPTDPRVRETTLKEVRARFAKGPTKKPWNCLELATHFEDGLRPSFLNSEDCRLLTKIKFPSSDQKAGRKGYEPGWKEVEKWALLAQAGALTEPHQDSHGYSSYITVNHGIFGFGWLSNPTDEERKGWSTLLNRYTGGRWRYAIVRPGQTVYFSSGTVHFVFRLPSAGDTLAFGGHILRCSQIDRWVATILNEQQEPNITNEDLSESAPAYLNQVEKFVMQALKKGGKHVQKWGGVESIGGFLEMKKEFERVAAGKGAGEYGVTKTRSRK